MESAKNEKNIASISWVAMKSQRASFRIEGIKIRQKRAEEIRREVVRSLKKGTSYSKS